MIDCCFTQIERMHFPTLLRKDRSIDAVPASHVQKATTSNPRKDRPTSRGSAYCVRPEQQLPDKTPGAVPADYRIAIEVFHDPSFDPAESTGGSRSGIVLRRIKLGQ